MNEIARRFFGGGIELRESGGDRPPTIVGYGAVFYRSDDPGTEFELFPGLMERIGRNAFDADLASGADVVALKNHSVSLILGRTTSGTMRLSTDDTGLRYEIDPADTTTARDLIQEIRRGDIRGSSFGFRVRAERFVEGKDVDLRIIEDVELIDVGPVTLPAYTATTTGVRAVSVSGRPSADAQDIRERMDQARRNRVYIDSRARVALESAHKA